jgi:hypothetical protein
MPVSPPAIRVPVHALRAAPGTGLLHRQQPLAPRGRGLRLRSLRSQRFSDGLLDRDSSLQVDERGREQIAQIIAREPDIVRQRIDPVNDDDLQVGHHG